MATNTEKIVVQVVVKGQKDLQRLEKRTGTTTKSFGKMAAGVVAAAAAFRQISQIVSSVIKSWKAFEFQMAKVKAITGATDKDFKKLTATAQLLGRTTFFTAQQVAELQTNYGKLGFTTSEILKAQEATLALATATDTDLARAAIVAGAAVRGFGLDAGETGRVTDVMAVSFTSSAMDIEKWQTSMTKVAPIAAAAGISIEATAAVMSKLTDTGIEASIAGTSLRNIFLKMQDSSSDLSQHLGFTVNSSEDLERALKQLNSEGLSNEEIMGLVDIRQVAAFNTMIRGAENIAELKEKLDGANGALNEMVDIITDNLEGDMKELTSAVDGLKQRVGEELSPSLREVTQELTDLTNEATDNADAMIEVGQKLKNVALFAVNLVAPLRKVKEAFQSILFMVEDSRWRKVTDFLGITTPKEAPKEEDFYVLRQERLNKQLEKTLGLSSSNAKQTVKSIKLTEDAIAAREKELEFIQLGAEGIGDTEYDEALKIRNKQETDRVNAEIKKLKEELKKKEEILKVHNDVIWQTKQSQKKIQDKKDAAQDEEDFQKEKERIDREAREKINQHKQGLLDTRGVLKPLEDAAFDIEKERLQKQLDLLIKYQQDTSVVSGQMLSNVLENIAKEAAAEAKAAKDKTEATDQLQKDKDDAFAADIKRAAMSGESASDAARKFIRAKIMEAVSIYIVGAFAANPFLGAIVAAGAGSLISGLFEDAFSDISFAKGGVIDEFANGGMVQGNSHAQGGEKFAVGGRVVELEGGEAVINKRSTAMFRRQLSAMNSVGGGVKFADGGLLNMPSFSQQQFNALGQNQMMGAMGGTSKVVVVEADITESQNTVSVIQSDATI